MNKIIKAIPNTITSCNLLCGAIATYFASKSQIDTALLLIVLAALFDFLDGTSARLLKAYSPMGVELDSLADMVSFGVAPSMAMFSILNDGKSIFAYSAFFLAVFSALRLAKFNIDTTQKTEFHGLPTPAMSLFVFSYALGFGYLPAWVSYIVVFAFSGLMVSPIVMFSLKFKNLSFKENMVRYFFVVFSALMIVFFTKLSFVIIIGCYILVSCLIDVCGFVSKRR